MVVAAQVKRVTVRQLVLGESMLGRALRQYQAHAAVHAAIDYNDPASVQAGNEAAIQMRKIAGRIGSKGEQAIEEFARFLEEPANDLCLWAAFHLLEVMTAPTELVDRAFEVLEQQSLEDDVAAFATRTRLRELRKLYGK